MNYDHISEQCEHVNCWKKVLMSNPRNVPVDVYKPAVFFFNTDLGMMILCEELNTIQTKTKYRFLLLFYRQEISVVGPQVPHRMLLPDVTMSTSSAAAGLPTPHAAYPWDTWAHAHGRRATGSGGLMERLTAGEKKQTDLGEVENTDQGEGCV